MTRVYVFPGQGSQKVGMGEGLFSEFPEETAAADEILGYSIETLCLQDPDGMLNRTDFTQPALYTVNALSYLKLLKDGGPAPDFTAGHSLGEYNALFAAGAFDFATGLKLVQKRGALMSQASGGGMAAVIGMSREDVEGAIASSGCTSVNIANLNSPAQIVISGLKDDILAAQPHFEEAGAKRYIPLNVSGAFHSPYMEPAREAFEAFMQGMAFRSPAIPVISNVEARPYPAEGVGDLLARQITSPVRWTESIEYLLQQPEPEFEEIGPGKVLTGLIRQITR